MPVRPADRRGWLGALVASLREAVLGGLPRESGRGRVAALEREVRRLEAEAETARLRFENFSQTAADWFWETDPEGRVTGLSRAGAMGAKDQYLGRRRDEIGVRAGPGDPAWRVYEEAMAARLPFRDFIYAAYAPDGVKRHISVSGRPVFAADGRFLGYHGAGRDVSDEIEADLALAAKNATLEAMLRTMPDGVQVLDRDLRVLAWNDQVFEVLGLDKAAIVASPEPARAFRSAFTKLIGDAGP